MKFIVRHVRGNHNNLQFASSFHLRSHTDTHTDVYVIGSTAIVSQCLFPKTQRGQESWETGRCRKCVVPHDGQVQKFHTTCSNDVMHNTTKRASTSSSSSGFGLKHAWSKRFCRALTKRRIPASFGDGMQAGFLLPCDRNFRVHFEFRCW